MRVIESDVPIPVKLKDGTEKTITLDRNAATFLFWYWATSPGSNIIYLDKPKNTLTMNQQKYPEDKIFVIFKQPKTQVKCIASRRETIAAVIDRKDFAGAIDLFGTSGECIAENIQKRQSILNKLLGEAVE
jgi:hypothetical protein